MYKYPNNATKCRKTDQIHDNAMDLSKITEKRKRDRGHPPKCVTTNQFSFKPKEFTNK